MFKKKNKTTQYMSIDEYYNDNSDLMPMGMAKHDTLEEAKIQVAKASSAYRGIDGKKTKERVYNDSNGLIIEISIFTDKETKIHWLYTKKVED